MADGVASTIAHGFARLLTLAAIGAIVVYRYTFSYFLGGRCRFYPSCSCYAQTAFATHGFVHGMWLTSRRLSRCHPFHPGGVDPVPPVVRLSK